MRVPPGGSDKLCGPGPLDHCLGHAWAKPLDEDDGRRTMEAIPEGIPERAYGTSAKDELESVWRRQPLLPSEGRRLQNYLNSNTGLEIV